MEGSTPPQLSRSFLRELHKLDREITLYWHPVMERWILYRAVRRSVTPSGDMLLKEFEIKGPRGEYREPGPWLLDWLRANDKTKGGSVDPEYADRKFLRKLDNEDKVREEVEQKKQDDYMSYNARLIEKHAIAFSSSQAMPKGTTKILKRKAKA